MKLGVLVNTARHLDHVLGLTRAAVAAGHEVMLFAMDEGVKLLENPSYTGLSALPGVSMSVCEHSVKEHGVRMAGVPEAIVRGSQFHNAVMSRSADRVIVL